MAINIVKYLITGLKLWVIGVVSFVLMFFVNMFLGAIDAGFAQRGFSGVLLFIFTISIFLSLLLSGYLAGRFWGWD